MNWNKGLLRVWLVAAVLWAAAVAGYGAMALGGRPAAASGVYAYSTAAEAFVPQQLAVTDGVLEDGVVRGVIVRIELDDHTTLFAPRDLGEDRLREITQRFQDQHAPVGARALLPWALGALLPPVGILLAGVLLSWILRGFRPGAVAAPLAEDTAPAEEPAAEAATAGWTSSSSSLPPFIRTLGPVQRRGRAPVRVLGQTGR
ncbi:hypothetical protein [Azospirillum rugosum]|uniref:Uncharacterized protein n=1 Tax=Azospirillum rugosum TaxID=416170 RepID=A0ABS4STU2_9PROT|nr:hypothetical protein [Azospirillum rugosum]MBP2295976.1 hypothetical protein [Azospirillum rugosum]MDQ0529566.1 hypothetical protein [Azospirillum rugosum]